MLQYRLSINFYDFVMSGKVSDDLTSRIHAAVSEARRNEDWRADYMKEMALFMDLKEEGRAEGLEKGHAMGFEEGKSLTLFSLIQDGDLSLQKGASKLGISVSELEKRMAEAGYHIPESV